MNTPYSYELRDFYPHMKPGDAIIWKKFIEQNPGLYDEVFYDWDCGDHWPIPDGTPPHIVEDWKILCHHKIDVVGIQEDRIDIIEIKPRASHKAIAQALNYTKLYLWDEEPSLELMPTVITDVELPNIRKLCEAHGIQFIVVQ